MIRNVPQEVVPPLCAAIGELVVNWAMVESAMGFWIAVIYQMAGGKRLEHKIPQPLAQRMRFLRRCFNQISVLEPFADEGRTLLDRLGAIIEIRHMVVHGTVSHYAQDTHDLLFVRIDLDKTKTMQVINELQIPIAKILDDSGKVMVIAAESLQFAHRLLDALVPDHKAYDLMRRL